MYNLKAIHSLRWYNCNIECVLSPKVALECAFFVKTKMPMMQLKRTTLKSLYLFFQHTVPENIHTSPMVGILFYNSPPSGNLIQFHTFPQIVLVLQKPVADPFLELRGREGGGGSFACPASSEPWSSYPRSVTRNPSSRWSLLSGCMDIFWTAQCDFFSLW